MVFSKLFVLMAWREKKRRRMDAERRKRERKSKKMLMDHNTKRNGAKDNLSFMESIDEQTSKGSPILSSLPNDLLDLIICNLDLVDRFHLGLVCKSFDALVHNAMGIHAKTKFGVPCLLILTRDAKTCSLINPLHKEKYTISTPSLPANTEILCAKDGWLLLVSEDQCSVFFFNPLTKDTIRLPDLTFPFFHSFAFSCPPTSPHCIVIASYCMQDLAVFHICRRGDEHWSEDFNVDGLSFDMRDTKPVFYRESLYCLGDDGRLATFDPVKLIWTVQEKPKSDGPNTHRHYLVESEGQLLRVGVENNLVHVCQLDHHLKQWKEVDSLGDSSLYVSWIASLSSKALSTSSRGKVYFPMLRGEEAVSFSCETGEIQDFYGTIYYPYSCWIELNCTRSSHEELQWSKT